MKGKENTGFETLTMPDNHAELNAISELHKSKKEPQPDKRGAPADKVAAEACNASCTSVR